MIVTVILKSIKTKSFKNGLDIREELQKHILLNVIYIYIDY